MRRGHKARPVEWLVEKGIFLVSLSAIVMVFLIFVFVAREAFPIVTGKMNSAAVRPALEVSALDKMNEAEIKDYLELTPKQFRQLDKDALKALMEVKVDEMKNASTDKDAKINTTEWKYLLKPYQWSGYKKPEYIWQPVSTIRKYNIIPLLIGSLKITLVALLFSVPLALGAAIYVSQLAPGWLREWLKPAVELLSSLPSVVVGFMALAVMAVPLQHFFGFKTPLNAFVAGISLAFAVIPVVFSIAEDALTSVPRAFSQAALALGASKWQAAWQVVLPAAIPGVFAAVVLGFGRAIGETMVVLMASGNASIVSWSAFDSTRSITATIASELAEAVFGGHHYRILFMLGALLFAVTFISNMVASQVIMRLKTRLEGKV